MVFKSAQVFIDKNFCYADVEVKNGVIINISDKISSDDFIDLTGKMLLPGLVDIHTHGCLGFDFCTADTSDISKMTDFYLSHGVTSILATIITCKEERLKASVSTINKCISDDSFPSIIRGINLEGPFFSHDKKGAHDPRYLRPLDDALLRELDSLSGNNIRLLDIDPMLEGSIPFIKKHSKTRTISLAHTSCDYELAWEAIKAGASHISHLFNAMNGIHHREPGLIGAFWDNDVYGELICDGFHIHPSVIRLMFKSNAEKIILISDSISAAGLSDGEYFSGGQRITVHDKKATLQNGTIAGSTISLYDGLKNAIAYGIPPEQATLSATISPAKSVGIDKLVGSIEVGKRADLLVTDQNFELLSVFVGGAEYKKNQ